MQRRFPAAFHGGIGLIAAAVFSVTGWTAEFYPTAPEGSVAASARPGQYYFELGVAAVRNRDYKHAREMYRIAASWAYKPAEYNLGVMYAKGEGVDADLPRAMAWMTLAAERNDKRYVEARDLIAANLDKTGVDRAEQILRDELLPDYGDAATLPRAKLRWREVRNEATGSHLGFAGNNLSVGAPGGRFVAVQSIFGATTNVMNGTPLGVPGLGPTVLAGQAGNPGMQTGFDVTGTKAVSGSTAYLALRETDNPYDPRFDIGTVDVGQPTSVGASRDRAAPTTTEGRTDGSAKQP